MMMVLSLSLSGSIIIAVIYLCRPLYKQRLSKRWQYYIWLIVIARLLLPFSLEPNLVGNLFNEVSQANPVQITGEASLARPARRAARINGEIPYTPSATAGESAQHQQIGTLETTTAAPSPQTSIPGTILSNIWIIWLLVACVLLVRKITIYQGFVRFIKAGRKPVEDMGSLERFGRILEEAGIRKTVGLYTNNLISSPLLIGFFRPYIVLPTLNVSESSFRHTVLHELAHYSRGDMFYKWLVQFTLCVHWFNPLVYVMANEINKACEFSCDESVIKNLDQNAILSYGDTLLNAVNIGGIYKSSISSVTLSGDMNILKERLDMIKSFRRKSRLAIAVALFAALILSIGALASGVYANNPGSNTHEVIGEVYNSADTGASRHASTVIDISNTAGQNNVVSSGSFRAGDGQTLALRITSSIRGGTVDLFLFAPDGTEHRFTIGTTALTQREIPLSYGVWAYNAFGMFSGGSISIVGTINGSPVAPTPPVPPTPPTPPAPPSMQPPQDSTWSWPWDDESFMWPWEAEPWPWEDESFEWPWNDSSWDWNWDWSNNWDNYWPNHQNWNVSGLQGIGGMVSRSFEPGGFTGLNISLAADVTWRHAQDTSVTVVMQENFFEYLTLYVRNGSLVIRSQTQLAITGANRPRIYIYAPYINNLVFSGAVSTVNWGTVYSEHFTITASGAVDVILDLQVDVLDINGSGAVDFILTGNVNTANIFVSGAVDFHSFDLQIKDAVLSVSGAADVDISVFNTLYLNVSGAADVRYKGNPTITRKSVSRNSNVIHVQ